MMHVAAKRFIFTEKKTISKVFIRYPGLLKCIFIPGRGPSWVKNDDTEKEYPFAYWLEDRDRGLDADMDLETILRKKLHGITAIPAGKDYVLTRQYSRRFGPDTLTIPDVKGYKYIRIHGGRDEDHTLGCPLLGLDYDKMNLVIQDSRPAVNWLKDRVGECEDRGETVYLDILRQGALYHV